MSNTLCGLVPLIGFVVLNAATDVYAGNKSRHERRAAPAPVEVPFAAAPQPQHAA